MKQTRLLVALLLCIFFIGKQDANAQLKRFSIGPYVEAAFPTGNFSDTHNTGFGVGLGADIKLVAGLTAVGSVGYMRFGGKDVSNGTGGSISMPAAQAIPIRLGLRYNLISILYVKVEGGTAQFVGDYNSGTGGLIAPGVGIRLLGLDVEAKYEAWFKNDTHSFFGLKASYNF
ncbi:hypothetical protein LX64_02329 [Chitinophaga skermanii]|uniref:Outer membrane protein with beta-barrel domain n=1 Tax=Chitinophaga skermanii TaxID=331697 RepID=A0A327QMS5_9BACT|nr:hypothetical protein [Chitinophaga skermanii]RAJ05175.1 hypothetical protein LX64_02329 [Chitinophaga skermanii]